MNGNSLTPGDLDVPRTRGQSINTLNATPNTTPIKRTNGSIKDSSSSSKAPDGSTRSTDPWNKKYVLTLDGGGVRGLSTLLIIQNIMALCHSFELSQDPLVKSSFHPLPFQEGQGSVVNKKSRSAEFLPFHYFDYIAGTSTGGLIAIMLSRLRMSIDDCIQEYENMGEKIFGQPRKFSMRGPIPWNQEKYDHRKMEEAIKDVLRRRHFKVDQFTDSMYPSNPDRCRTIVLAIRENESADAPYLFRTYDYCIPPSIYAGELNPGLAQAVPIWQVARATTAAPTYFKPFQLNGERFVDGGFGFSNNPTSRTFAEVEQLHGKGKVALTLSIGTGRSTKVKPLAIKDSGLLAHYRQIFKYTAATTTDSESTHKNVKTLLDALQCPYERFNVDGGLGDINLGEWHIQGKENITLKKIREQTLAYLNQSEVQNRMEQVAKMLVKNRQERSKTVKWDFVATGHRYRCLRECDKEMIFLREDDLRVHLCDVHDYSSAPGNSNAVLRLEKAINDGRILHAD